MNNNDLQQALLYANSDVQQRANLSPLRAQYSQYWFSSGQEQQDAARFISDYATLISTQQRMPVDQALALSSQTIMPIMVANFAVSSGIAPQLAYQEQLQVNELIGKGKQIAAAVAQLYAPAAAPQAFVQQMHAPQAIQPYGGQGNWQQQQHMGVTFNKNVPATGAVISPNQEQPMISNYVPGSAITIPPAAAVVLEPLTQAIAVDVKEKEVDEDLVFKPSSKQPYRYVYDPSQDRINLKVIDGIVVEEIEDISEMDYEELETRKFKSTFAVDDGKVAETAWGALSSNEVDVVQPSGDIKKEEIKYMGNLGNAYHGLFAAMVKLRRANRENPDICWEFSYTVPRVIDTLSSQIGNIVAATKDNDAGILAGALAQQFHESTENVDGVCKWTSTEGFGLPGWAAYERFATKLVNDSIRKHLGKLGVMIDSFAEDWNDLVKLMTKKHGEHFIARVLPKLNRYLINRLKPTTGEPLKAFIKAEGAPDFSNTGLLFTENIHVTALNVMAGDLRIAWEDDLGVVCQSITPNLHAALVGIMKRAIQRNPVTTIYLVTLDDRIIEVTNAWLMDESFLLTIVD